MSGPLRVLTLLAAVIGIAACDAERPVAPTAPPDPAQLRGIAITLTVDAKTGAVTYAAPNHLRTDGLGPSFALLGQNEIGVTTSNFSRSAVGAYVKKQVRITYDIALTNRLQGVALVTPTFPAQLGEQGLMLFPFRIDRIVGKGSVVPSDDWDGDGTSGSGKPYNFFNDPKCNSGGCFRWKGFPSPLGGGATTPARTIGFDVDPEVQSFELYLVLAADVQNPPAPRLSGTVTSPEKGPLAGILVSVAPGGQTTRTDALGRYSLGPLAPGGAVVTLADLPSGCSAIAAKSVTLTVGQTATADFEVSCPGRIAFVSTRTGKYQIYVMNAADGSGLQQLSDGDANDFQPAWSPDGRRIAFSSNRGGKYQIYTMNADGSDIRRVSAEPESAFEPAWSPDGKRIAFASSRGGKSQIYVIDADGANVRQFISGSEYLYTPAWSPDGSRIAYVSYDGQVGHVFVINADGGVPQRLSGEIGSDADPTWSPDGSRIAVSSTREGNPQIFVIDSSGGSASRISDGVYESTHPTWSPDGRRIAFMSRRDGKPQIYVIDSSGGSASRISDALGQDEHPVWQP